MAKSAEFVAFVSELADLVAAKGVDAVAERADELDAMKITLKENISLGRVVRIEAPADGAVDSYLHMQAGRGVNAVAVAVAGRLEGARPRHRRPHRLRPPRLHHP